MWSRIFGEWKIGDLRQKLNEITPEIVDFRRYLVWVTRLERAASTTPTGYEPRKNAKISFAKSENHAWIKDIVRFRQISFCPKMNQIWFIIGSVWTKSKNRKLWCWSDFNINSMACQVILKYLIEIILNLFYIPWFSY